MHLDVDKSTEISIFWFRRDLRLNDNAALFEALKNNNIGFKGNLINIQDQEKALFGEINSRYLISTSKSDELISYLDSNKVPFVKLGYTCGNTIEFNSISLDMKELLSQYNNSIELEMET